MSESISPEKTSDLINENQMSDEESQSISPSVKSTSTAQKTEEDLITESIAALEMEVQELQTQFAQRNTVSELEKETLRNELKEAQEDYTLAVRLFNEAEARKLDIQPLYEESLQNWEQKERGEMFKKDITEHEEELRKLDVKVESLNFTLTEISAEYRQATTDLNEFKNQLKMTLCEASSKVLFRISSNNIDVSSMVSQAMHKKSKTMRSGSTYNSTQKAQSGSADSALENLQDFQTCHATVDFSDIEVFSNSNEAVTDLIKRSVDLLPLDCIILPTHHPKDAKSVVENSLDVVTRERELRLYNVRCQNREMKALCEIKKNDCERIRNETDVITKQKQRDNDEYIKSLIYHYQDVRARLQVDLQEVHRVNEDQAYNLKRGHVQKTLEKNVFTKSKKSVNNSIPRKSEFRDNTGVTSNELQFIRSGYQQLQQELQSLKKKLQVLSSERTAALKEQRSIEAKSKREEERYREALSALNMKIAAEKAATEMKVSENKRLRTAVVNLNNVARTTKEQLSNIRVTHVPLPVEDDA